MTMKLVIGNRNYSSWSMRPWVCLRAANIPFEEIFIPLYTGDADKQRILDVSPAGKVPALIDGGITVWDSLAIIEYVAEKYPDAKLWPGDRAARGQGGLEGLDRGGNHPASPAALAAASSVASPAASPARAARPFP